MWRHFSLLSGQWAESLYLLNYYRKTLICLSNSLLSGGCPLGRQKLLRNNSDDVQGSVTLNMATYLKKGQGGERRSSQRAREVISVAQMWCWYRAGPLIQRPPRPLQLSPVPLLQGVLVPVRTSSLSQVGGRAGGCPGCRKEGPTRPAACSVEQPWSVCPGS